MSSVFVKEDFMSYKRISYKSNVRSSFPMSLADPSYYVPNDSGLNNNRNVSKGSFDIEADSKNGSVDWRLAKIRKPGLDISEVSKLAIDIQNSVEDSVSSDVKKAVEYDSKSKADKAKIDSALQSVINSQNKSDKSDD